jgi:mono/diheme cytochrome c family protein
MKVTPALLLMVFLLNIHSAPSAQTPLAPSGGALLYQTYCSGCHSTQIHWREHRLAHDWATLRHQVVRWQANSRLEWSDEEIDEVAHYLNSTIYHFPESGTKPIG